MKFLDVPQSGSIADRTHSHNRAGQYTRNRRSPVQPVGTGRRAFIRSAFGNASSAWAALTSTEQAAWVTYADSHPAVDRLGQSIKLTGHQMFVAIQTQLANCLQAATTTPPTDSSVWAITTPVLTATAGTPTLTVGWDEGPTDSFICIAFSRPLSAGRTFPGPFWQCKTDGADAGTENLTTQFVAQFGALSIGQKIFCKLTPVNPEGVTGTPTIISVRIAT